MPQIKTRRKMGWLTTGFHMVMMVCTIGLWTPVFVTGRRRRLRVMEVPAGYQGRLSKVAQPQRWQPLPRSQRGWQEPPQGGYHPPPQNQPQPPAGGWSG
jgi:hypothetical protein